MFYKLSVLASNNSLIKRLLRKTRKIAGRPERVNLTDLIKRYSPGKSFADIGCLWGVDGYNSFLAEESGATKIVAVDIYPESAKFTTERKKRGSKLTFVQGDIALTETTRKIGTCDVVLCSGVIYHTPDPLHMLMNLRAITNETLILNTTSIPELPGVRNAAVFYPFLDASQRKIWNRGIGMQKAITGPYEAKEGYANWFWGMTPSCLESLLVCAGFEIIERHIFRFDCAFVCRAVSKQFVPESGEWTTPGDPDSLQFRR